MVAPHEALHHAVRSLTDGPGDPTSIEGAKVNALESIAWGLIGILATKVEDPKAVEDLSSALAQFGFITTPQP